MHNLTTMCGMYRLSIRSHVTSVVSCHSVNIHSRRRRLITAPNVHARLIVQLRCMYTSACTPVKNRKCARSVDGLSNIVRTFRNIWWSTLADAHTSVLCAHVLSMLDTVCLHTCANIPERVLSTVTCVVKTSAPKTASRFDVRMIYSLINSTHIARTNEHWLAIVLGV